MVDTVQYRSVLELDDEWFGKLLLGAIDKDLDRKKIEVYDPATDMQNNSPALSPRFKPNGKDEERRWSDDDTLVGPSSR